VAPDALLVNFTNPSGVVTEALQRFAPDVHSVGVCNAPIGMKMGMTDAISERLGTQIAYERAELKGLGLNHLSWYTGFSIDGEDMWQQVFSGYVEELRQEKHHGGFDADTVEALGMIPNYYLHYFYYTNQVLAEQQKWPPSRGETALSIEKDLLHQYADPALREPPADLMKRGGAHYSTVATQLMSSHYNNLGETHIVNTRHNGAVPGWNPDWVLEMPCRIDRNGIHPLTTDPLPPAAFGLLAKVKAYEILTAEAGVTGDRRLAYQAMLVNPLGPSADQVGAVLDDLLETHKAYLPQFWS
jgi:6-phospho-beta-glucosidase